MTGGEFKGHGDTLDEPSITDVMGEVLKDARVHASEEHGGGDGGVDPFTDRAYRKVKGITLANLAPTTWTKDAVGLTHDMSPIPGGNTTREHSLMDIVKGVIREGEAWEDVGLLIGDVGRKGFGGG